MTTKIASVNDAESARSTGVAISDLSLDWLKIIDSLKMHCEFAEDQQLAKYLGIQPIQLSEFRSGRINLAMIAKIKALDSLGFHLAAEIFELLLNDENAERQRRARERQAKKLAEARSS